MRETISWPPAICIDCGLGAPIGHSGGAFNPRCKVCHAGLTRRFLSIFRKAPPPSTLTDAQKAHRAFVRKVSAGMRPKGEIAPIGTLADHLARAVESRPVDANGTPAQLYRLAEGTEYRIYRAEWASALARLRTAIAGEGWAWPRLELASRQAPITVTDGRTTYDLEALIDAVGVSDTLEDALRSARVGVAAVAEDEADAATRPAIVKWAGGKREYAAQIVGLILSDGKAPTRYVEPFAGGLAVYFALRAALEAEARKTDKTQPALAGVAAIRPMPPAALSDYGPEIAATWAAVQAQPDDVIAAHETIRRLYAAAWKQGPDEAEAFYYSLRARHETFQAAAPAGKAAWFLAMNRLGFNGLWRVNRKGRNNVPWGKAPPTHLVAPDRIRAAAKALEGATIAHRDFRDALAEVEEDAEGVALFLDPPYAETFDAYTAGGFSAESQAELAERARRCAKAGARVVITLNDVASIRKLYPDKAWVVVEAGERRAINRDAGKRGGVPCVVITNRTGAR